MDKLAGRELKKGGVRDRVVEGATEARFGLDGGFRFAAERQRGRGDTGDMVHRRRHETH